MKILDVTPLAIPDVKLIRFARFEDERGFFTEPYRQSQLQEVIGAPIVQMNESYSRAGVLRGLHFQWNPYMGKLVRIIYGEMDDLTMDIRLGSPTFGKIVSQLMAPGGRNIDEWLWVPPGFAHGNYFNDNSHIEYLCTGEYNPDCEACIRASYRRRDSIVSDKDRHGMTLEQWKNDPRSENFRYPMVTP